MARNLVKSKVKSTFSECMGYLNKKYLNSCSTSINKNVSDFQILKTFTERSMESSIGSRVSKFILSKLASPKGSIKSPVMTIFPTAVNTSPKLIFSSYWKRYTIISCSCVGVLYLCLERMKEKGLLPSVQAITPNITQFNFIADVVSKAAPAVVFLEIKGTHPESGKRLTMSNGSGFVVKDTGLVLTSAHVVTNNTKLTVKLHDGDALEGTVLAVDPVHDLAVVKINAGRKLPTIPLGRSSAIRPGEFVVAMGSPLSLSNTVTSGIVSSSLRKSKELGLHNKDMQYIQTDAVISYGNSGGPLVNLDGKAIGINNLKVTTGISFAIPADYAISFVEEAEKLEGAGFVSSPDKSNKKRRYMGITMLSLNPLIIHELKDRLASFPEVENGVYVHKVMVGSPAYDGGIHAGDIIVGINGTKIKSTADVYDAVDESKHLDITIIRGDGLRKFRVTTEQLF